MQQKPTPAIPKPDFLTEEQWQLVLDNRSRDKQKAVAERDTELYLRTAGKGDIAMSSLGGSTLLLTAIGRKSGREITTPLLYFRDGDDVVVIGSCAGLPEDPNWWLNLQKTPQAWVQIGPDRWPVVAQKADPATRARLWRRVVETFPLWDHFQKHSEREFPVIQLRRDDSPRTSA